MNPPRIARSRSKSPTIAQQIADAASACEERRTPHRPKSATVQLNDDMLAITLRGALAPADTSKGLTPERAARFRNFHGRLFANALQRLQHEIKCITGVDVCEATAEIHLIGQDATLYATGTIVQMFLLARTVASDHWSGTVQGPSWETSAEPIAAQLNRREN